MNTINDRKIINQAKLILAEADSDIFHGIHHAKGVATTAKEILKYYPQADKRAVMIAAWWHDVGRKDLSEGHEQHSADLVSAELAKLNYDKAFMDKVSDAIKFHGLSMHPTTIEGQIIRDSDKLGYISIPRWKRVLKSPEYKSDTVNGKRTLLNFRDKVFRLDSSILELDISKQIYDFRFPKFEYYINKIAKF